MSLRHLGPVLHRDLEGQDACVRREQRSNLAAGEVAGFVQSHWTTLIGPGDLRVVPVRGDFILCN